MTTTPSKAPSTPLAADFADRIEALREEAEAGGHGDVEHLLAMAAEIAHRRIKQPLRPSPSAASDDRLPN